MINKLLKLLSIFLMFASFARAEYFIAIAGGGNVNNAIISTGGGIVKNITSINKLKVFLGNHIPKYMIPTYFIVLNDFICHR